MLKYQNMQVELDYLFMIFVVKIHLLQEMLEHGVAMSHVDTPGGYIEVDTQQDFDYARKFWIERHKDR